MENFYDDADDEYSVWSLRNQLQEAERKINQLEKDNANLVQGLQTLKKDLTDVQKTYNNAEVFIILKQKINQYLQTNFAHHSA